MATGNYSDITNLHTLQFTIASTKSSQSAVFTSHSLVMAPNAVDSSDSMFCVLTVKRLSHTNCSWLQTLAIVS
jgi:hypothetical protein